MHCGLPFPCSSFLEVVILSPTGPSLISHNYLMQVELDAVCLIEAVPLL